MVQFSFDRIENFVGMRKCWLPAFFFLPFSTLVFKSLLFQGLYQSALCSRWVISFSRTWVKVISPSINNFFNNPSNTPWNYIVGARIQWPGCILQVIKHLHLQWNFSEHLKDCNHDLLKAPFIDRVASLASIIQDETTGNVQSDLWSTISTWHTYDRQK